MKARRPSGDLPALILWIGAVALVLRFTIGVLHAAGRPANGFVAHHTASRLILEGAGAAALYDDSVFIAEVDRAEPGVVDIFGANPPTVALAAVPLSFLDYRGARLVWTVASLCAWFLSVLWLSRALCLGGVWVPTLLCGAALFEPAAENLGHGQFHVLVLVLVLAAWSALRRGRPAGAGTALGLALGLKAAGVVFWPLLAVRRQWRALAWGAATLAVLAVLVFALSPGMDAWAAFIDRARGTAASGSLSVTAYQTVPGLIHRLTVRSASWNPAPLFDLGSAGSVISWCAVLAMLGHSLVKARGSDVTGALAAFAALGLAISPVSLDYHYVVAIFPATVLVAWNRDRMLKPAGLLTIAAVVLIALDLPYRSPRLADGAMALLAYPKLYGVLILWWLLQSRPSASAMPRKHVTEART